MVPGRNALAEIGEGSSPGRNALAEIGEGSSPGRNALAEIGEGSSPGRNALAEIGEGLVPGRNALAENCEGLVPGRKGLAEIGEGSVRDSRYQLGGMPYEIKYANNVTWRQTAEADTGWERPDQIDTHVPPRSEMTSKGRVFDDEPGKPG